MPRAEPAVLKHARAIVRGGLIALWRAVVTVWRVAEMLDSALWRGTKRIARTLGRGAAAFARMAAGAFADFAAWLPTRAGRAYCAFSSIVVVLAGLWIIDELRPTPAEIAEERSSSPGAPPVDEKDPILARIGARYVRLSDVRGAAIAAGDLSPEARLTAENAFARGLVHAHVEQRLLAAAAEDEGLHRERDVARRLDAARARLLAGAFLDEQVDAAVTDEAVRALYRAHVGATRLGDEVEARHIVVATAEEAERIVTALEVGADFASLARQKSIERWSGAKGGYLGLFTKDMMDPQLSKAAFALAPGETSTPFKTKKGWHVLTVLRRRATNGVPLTAVEADLREFLRLRAIERTMASLSETQNVVYYEPRQKTAPDAASASADDALEDFPVAAGVAEQSSTARAVSPTPATLEPQPGAGGG